MALKDWQLQFLEREAALGKDYGKLQSDMGWGGMARGLKPENEPITLAEGGMFSAPQGGYAGLGDPDYWSGIYNQGRDQGGGPVTETPGGYAGLGDPDYWRGIYGGGQGVGAQYGGQGGGQGQGGQADQSWDDPLAQYGTFVQPPHLYDPNRAGGTYPINKSDPVVLSTSGGGGPTGPVDPSANPNLWTSPMPGYIQFHPGGAVYEWTDDAATMQANQHLHTPVSGMDWHRRFGIDQYIPDPTSFVAGASLPKSVRDVVPTDFTRRDQWIREHRKGEIEREPGALLGYTPGEKKQIDKILLERAQNELARRQQEIANYLGGGGGVGGGTFGGGSWQGQAFSPYDPYNFPQQSYGYSASGIPPAEVSGYATPPVVPAGEPSFLPDPNPLDAHLELNSIGLERVPVDARLELDKWLKNMGYTTASLGQFGPQAYTRPTGWADEIAFTADDYGRITDPIVRGWIKWLLGEMGYSTASQYPGAVAP